MIKTISKACKWVAVSPEQKTINDKLRLAVKQSDDTTNGPERDQYNSNIKPKEQ